MINQGGLPHNAVYLPEPEGAAVAHRLTWERFVLVHELIRTNNAVVLSLVRAVLADAGIYCHVADEAISSVEGSIGAFPRRVLIAAEDVPRARRLVIEAGIDATMLSTVQR